MNTSRILVQRTFLLIQNTTLKILIAQLSLGKRNFQHKFERLRKHVESPGTELLDDFDSNIYSVIIPVYLRGRGQDVEMKIKCQLKLKGNNRHSYLEVSADITKPLILTVLIGLVPSIIVFLINNSITASLLVLIFGIIISSLSIFIPLNRQVERKVRDWLTKD
ncbi:MAG: hypothetical protein COA32_10215 [Fluviicola sp.]|nr:MAG: hypothetical protein COA32_10215 [Fluviicola sp.]